MLEGYIHRSDPSGEDLGLQCCWRSGLRHGTVLERARLTHSDEEARVQKAQEVNE